VLEVGGLSVGYGGPPVVEGATLSVGPGEVVALLGPNGSGKTTLLLAISGVLRPQRGGVQVLGAAVGGRPQAVARRGVAHVPQGRGLFPGLTVSENLVLAARRRRPDLTGVLALFPALEPLLGRRAGLLSGGEQQMLALARGLVARPRLLLVDEMSMGLAPLVVEQLLTSLRRVAGEEGTAVLVVEQHVHLALAVAHRGYVLRRGRIVQEGPAAELARRPDLLQASYLGEAGEEAAPAG